MNLQLFGKNALVCGASKGIGRAAAIELAGLGANVTLLARSADALSALSKELPRKEGQEHGFLVADFQDTGSLQEKIEAFTQETVVHVLVNNTGGPPGGPITEASTEAFLKAYNNHLICNHLITQAVLPGMKEAGYGRIINVISTSVKIPIHGLGVSNTTRGAVANWAKTLANEVAKYKITVNNVLPGTTKTGRIRELIGLGAQKRGVAEQVIEEEWRARIPLGRFAEPAEVAAAIAFLASPAASYITGINVPVDGGRTGCL